MTLTMRTGEVENSKNLLVVLYWVYELLISRRCILDMLNITLLRVSLYEINELSYSK